MYPLPSYATSLATEAASSFFESVASVLDELERTNQDTHRQAQARADWLGDAKWKLKTDYLTAKREEANKLRNSHRQKSTRLHQQLRGSE